MIKLEFRPLFLAIVFFFAGTVACAQEKLKLIIPEGNASGIYKSQFIQNGKRLLTIGRDGQFQVWDANIGKLYFSIPKVMDFLVSNKQDIAVLSRDSIVFVLDLTKYLLTDSIQENKEDLQRGLSEMGIYTRPIISFDETQINLYFLNHWNERRKYSLAQRRFIGSELLDPNNSKSKVLLSYRKTKVLRVRLDSTRYVLKLVASNSRSVSMDTIGLDEGIEPTLSFSNSGNFFTISNSVSHNDSAGYFIVTSIHSVFNTKDGARVQNLKIKNSTSTIEFTPDDEYLLLHRQGYYGEGIYAVDGATKILNTTGWKPIYSSTSWNASFIDNARVLESMSGGIAIHDFKNGTLVKQFKYPLKSEISFQIDQKQRKAFLSDNQRQTNEILDLSSLNKISLESNSPGILAVHASGQQDSIIVHYPSVSHKVKLNTMSPKSYPRGDTILVSDSWSASLQIDQHSRFAILNHFLYNLSSLRRVEYPFKGGSWSNTDLGLIGNYILTIKTIDNRPESNRLELFDFKTNTLKWSNEITARAMATLSSSEKYVVTLDSTHVELYDTKTGANLMHDPIKFYADEFYFDDRNELLVLVKGDRLQLYSTRKHAQVFETRGLSKIMFDRLNRKIVGIGDDSFSLSSVTTINLDDLKTTKHTTSIFIGLDYIVPQINSRASHLLIGGYKDRTKALRELDLETGEEIDLSCLDDLRGIQYINDSLIASFNLNRIRFFQINQKTKKVSESPDFIPFNNSDYVVYHRSGLFDGTPDAINKLYFAIGGDIIELNQLKERYYEPNLWKKAMNGERLRDVAALTNVELPPDIMLASIDFNGNLPVTLTNRDAGIGKVAIFINGKEIIPDARKSASDKDKKILQLSIPIKDHPYLLPGKENLIEVRAWNGGGWIVSRPASLTYVAPSGKGSKGAVADVVQEEKVAVVPNIYILASGVSDYAGDQIDLKYAAKDAESASNALSIGASRMFGTDKSFVYLLTSSNNISPTKKNIVSTFKTIASKATSSDIFVVYLSGHGINWGGHDGDFHYLTADAYSTSLEAYDDPAIRDNATISSKELVELFKTVPALKQVLIIDACASGRMVENLMGKRDISSSTLRALDRMKDRTGMHIITGCAADAVSYEASRYGQGVLTYSIIEAIKGAKLRDNEFIDINQLFQYARDRVPVLAQGIGGIQSPQIFSPNGAQSFDIGKMMPEDKEKVKLAKTRPLYTRSNFLNKTELSDNLELSKLIDEGLNEISSRGEASRLIFMDVNEFPEACKLTGIYESRNGKLYLSLKKSCGKETKIIQLEGSSKEQMLKEVLEKIN